MPKLLTSKDQFLEIAKRSREIRLKKTNGSVKLKLRTSRHLYTIILPEKEAEDLAKQTGLTIVRL